MKGFYPQTGSPEDWNAAFYRLEDYLRAHQVTNKVHQSQIILRLLQRAAARHAQDPTQLPTRLALEEAYTVIDDWFRRLLPEESEPRAAIIGRVSMYISRAAERWPNAFLMEHPELPPDFIEIIRETSLVSGPDLRVSSMVPRPLDADPGPGLLDETQEGRGRFWRALLAGIAGLFAGAAVFYFAW